MLSAKQQNKVSYLIILILFAIVSYLIANRNFVVSIHSLHEYGKSHLSPKTQHKNISDQHTLAYLSNISFNNLSPRQQTKRLHEMFKFEINKYFVSKLDKNNKRPINAAQTIQIINKLYKSMHDSLVNFIQIGACNANFDAVGYNDPFQKIIIRNKVYHGVMIEPVPYLFNDLVKNMNNYIGNNSQRILFLNAAFNENDGMQIFYSVNVERLFEDQVTQSTDALNQIGSFFKQHLVKHLAKLRKRKHEFDYYIDEIHVKTLSAKSIWNLYIENGEYGRDGTIDIVEIDAEGYDHIVVKAFLKDNILPLVIIYENLHLTVEDEQNMIDLLNAKGYISFKYGWNSIAIRFANLV